MQCNLLTAVSYISKEHIEEGLTTPLKLIKLVTPSVWDELKGTANQAMVFLAHQRVAHQGT